MAVYGKVTRRGKGRAILSLWRKSIGSRKGAATTPPREMRGGRLEIVLGRSEEVEIGEFDFIFVRFGYVSVEA